MVRSIAPAKIITPKDLAVKRYPLPKSWTDAIGVLKGRGLDPVSYEQQIRVEWGKRLKRQIRLGGTRHGH